MSNVKTIKVLFWENKLTDQMLDTETLFQSFQDTEL